jgi:hypothetical protein
MIFLSYFLILRNNFRLFRTTTKKESTVSVSSEHDQLFDKITELVRRHHQQKESILVLRISLKSGKLLGGAWGGGGGGGGSHPIFSTRFSDSDRSLFTPFIIIVF